MLLKMWRRGVKVLTVFLAGYFLLVPVAQMSAVYAQETPDPSTLIDHNIEVCFVGIDKNGNVFDNYSLPDSTKLSIRIYADNPEIYRPTEYAVTPTYVVFNTNNDVLNTDVIDNDGIADTYCQTLTFQNPVEHGYVYSQASVDSPHDWSRFEYNDENLSKVRSVNDLFAYSDEFFDGIEGNEDNRNTNSDGHMYMDGDRATRRLFVLAQLDDLIDRSETLPDGEVKILQNNSDVDITNSISNLSVQYSAFDRAYDDSDPSGIHSVRFSNDGFSWQTIPSLPISSDCPTAPNLKGIGDADTCNLWDGSVFNTTDTMSSISEDGSYTRYMEIRDVNGNISIKSDTFILDTKAPQAKVSIGINEYDESNPERTGSKSNYITYSAEDTLDDLSTADVSGVDAVRFAFNSNYYGSWQDYSSGTTSGTKTFQNTWTNCTGSTCTLEVKMQARDKVGNVITVSDTIEYFNENISFDFSINDNQEYTKSEIVALKIRNQSVPIDQVRFKYCTNSCTDTDPYKQWINFSPNFADSLYEGYRSEKKTICVQARTNLGTLSEDVCDDILLDKLPPEGLIQINNGAEKSTTLNLTLNLDASDPNLPDGKPGAGEVKYRISTDGLNWTEWADLTPTHTITAETSGQITVFAQFKDKLGNESQTFSDNILVDTTLIGEVLGTNTGSIRINNDEAYTDSNIVDLTLAMTGSPTHMKIWNQGETPPTQKELFQTKKHWNLFDVSTTGTKRVYVEYFKNNTSMGIAFDEIVFAPRHAIEYTAISEVPTTSLSHSFIDLSLNVKNKGFILWTPQSRNTDNPVNISYHWYQIDPETMEETLYEWEGARGNLTHNVNFNQSHQNIFLQVQTPTDAGLYNLKIDAIHEGVTWFSGVGNPTPTFQVRIDPNPNADPEPLPDIDYEGEYGVGANVASITRGELAKRIVQDFDFEYDTSGTTFPDVPSSHPYFKYIQTLKNNGVVKGYTGGKFQPDTKVDRSSFTAFVVRSLDERNVNINHNYRPRFSDVNSENSFYDYINFLTNVRVEGDYVMDGWSRTEFGVNRDMDRSEAYDVIERALLLIPKEWDAELTSRSQGGVITIRPGQTIISQAKYKNVGSERWSKTNTYLQTYSPKNRTSDFQDSEWISTYRVTQYEENSSRINSGSTATFEFNFKVPENKPVGSYLECFAPNSNNKWMDDEPVCWTINVIDPRLDFGRIFCTDGTTYYQTASTQTPRGTLPYGTTVTIYTTLVSGWKQIKVQNSLYWIEGRCFEKTGTVPSDLPTSADEPYERPTGDIGVIISTVGVNVYPNTVTYNSEADLPYGTEVQVLRQTPPNDPNFGSWLEVRTSDGKVGWVPRDYVDMAPGFNPPIYIPNTKFDPAHVCNDTDIPLKFSPTWSSLTIQTIYRLQNLRVIEDRGDWLKVSLLDSNFGTGYIHKAYLCDDYARGNTHWASYDFRQPFGPLVDAGQDEGDETLLFGPRSLSGDFHYATDYGLACGRDIYAVQKGVVVSTQTNGVVAGNNSTPSTPSNVIVIEHDNGFRSTYVHLNEVLVQVGQRVERGALIGKSGNTGYVRGNPSQPVEEQGCHLHFEIEQPRTLINELFHRNPMEVFGRRIDLATLNELKDNFFSDEEFTNIPEEYGVGSNSDLIVVTMHVNSDGNDLEILRPPAIKFLKPHLESLVNDDDYDLEATIKIPNNKVQVIYLDLNAQRSFGESLSLESMDVEVHLRKNSDNSEIEYEYIEDENTIEIEGDMDNIQVGDEVYARIEISDMEDFYDQLESESAYYFDFSGMNGSSATHLESSKSNIMKVPCSGVDVFTDICDSPFKQHIINLHRAGIVSGYSDKTYRPKDFVTREQMAKFVHKAFESRLSALPDTNCKTFPDVKGDNVFKENIRVLTCKGIVKGFSDGNFKGGNAITRQEAAKFIVAASGMSPDLDCNLFNDVGTGHTFYRYIQTLKCKGISAGFEGGTKFKPENVITRGEMAKFIDVARGHTGNYDWNGGGVLVSSTEVTSCYGDIGREVIYTDKIVHISRYGTYEIREAMKEGYERDGGFEVFGFAKTNANPWHANKFGIGDNIATDGYIQNFEKGIASIKTMDNGSSFRKFVKDDCRSYVDELSAHLYDTDFVYDTHEEILNPGSGGIPVPAGLAYKSLSKFPPPFGPDVTEENFRSVLSEDINESINELGWAYMRGIMSNTDPNDASMKNLNRLNDYLVVLYEQDLNSHNGATLIKADYKNTRLQYEVEDIYSTMDTIPISEAMANFWVGISNHPEYAMLGFGEYLVEEGLAAIASKYGPRFLAWLGVPAVGQTLGILLLAYMIVQLGVTINWLYNNYDILAYYGGMPSVDVDTLGDLRNGQLPPLNAANEQDKARLFGRGLGMLALTLFVGRNAFKNSGDGSPSSKMLSPSDAVENTFARVELDDVVRRNGDLTPGNVSLGRILGKYNPLNLTHKWYKGVNYEIKAWDDLLGHEKQMVENMILPEGSHFLGVVEDSARRNFDGFIVKQDGSFIPVELKQASGNINTIVNDGLREGSKQLSNNSIEPYGGRVLMTIENLTITQTALKDAIKRKHQLDGKLDQILVIRLNGVDLPPIRVDEL